MKNAHRDKEFELLLKKEQIFREKMHRKKESAINRLLADKVPEKLQRTVDSAFAGAFSFILDKGTPLIEKTYNRDEREKDFKVDMYSDELRGTRRSLRKFSRKADAAGGINLALSGVSGIGMGLLGMGLPDIPLFTGMILRCIYETAMSYGFDYDTEEEKYFILLIIEGAVSYGDRFEEVNGKIESFIKHPCLPYGYIRAEQIRNTGSMLSTELLYMKFLQGIPIAGAIGGAYDIIYMNKISKYARMKYKKRFLLS